MTDVLEGLYMEQDTEPIYDREQLIGYNRVGQHEVDYVSFRKH
ncbi:MAG: hypothetical protein R2680_06050 [Nitrososphaeraceae archaeon]